MGKKRKDRMDDLFVEEEAVVKTEHIARSKDADLPLYDDVGDYKPKKDSKSDERRDRKDDRRDKERGREDRRRDDKRDRDRERDRYRDGRDRDRDRDRWDRDDRHKKESDSGSREFSYFDKPEEPREREHRGFSAEDKLMIKALIKKKKKKKKK